MLPVLEVSLKTVLKCNLPCSGMSNMLTERGAGNIAHEFHFSCNRVLEFIANNIHPNSCMHLLGMQYVGNINNKNSQTSNFDIQAVEFLCFVASSSMRMDS